MVDVYVGNAAIVSGATSSTLTVSPVSLDEAKAGQSTTVRIGSTTVQPASGSLKATVDALNTTIPGQAEAFDHAGKFARRFKVISGQKIEGAWYLKQMRIEAPAGPGKDKMPTYLEVEGIER